MRKWFSDSHNAKYEGRYHQRYGHRGYYSPGRRSSVSIRSIVKWAVTLLVLFTLYVIFFGINVSSSFFGTLKLILYAGEAVIFFGGLFVINSVHLGSSDLGVWGMAALGLISIFFGAMFFLFSGFAGAALGVDALFGLILMILGAFMVFRSRRRYGQFVYLR